MVDEGEEEGEEEEEGVVEEEEGEVVGEAAGGVGDGVGEGEGGEGEELTPGAARGDHGLTRFLEIREEFGGR